jgi:hypothetical protein
MKLLGTSFALVLGAWRLRISIDLDEDPEIKTLAMQHVAAARRNDSRVPHDVPKW